MGVDGEVDAPGEALDGALEACVLEGDDVAARVAQQVMVMPGGVGGLVASHALAQVHALDEPQPVEQLERAVDAGQPDPSSSHVQAVRDLACGGAAAELGEGVDHALARTARAVAGSLERQKRVLGPARGGHRPRIGCAAVTDVYRTPDERFDDLPGYTSEPCWFETDGLRLHYVDEGGGEPVV
jgi:hypothetical protein